MNYNSSYILKFVFFVIDGSVESVHYDAIIARIKQLCYGLDSENIDPVSKMNLFNSLNIIMASKLAASFTCTNQ